MLFTTTLVTLVMMRTYGAHKDGSNHLSVGKQNSLHSLWLLLQKKYGPLHEEPSCRLVRENEVALDRDSLKSSL
jgi:hypothetical protein